MNDPQFLQWAIQGGSFAVLVLFVAVVGWYVGWKMVPAFLGEITAQRIAREVSEKANREALERQGAIITNLAAQVERLTERVEELVSNSKAK